MKSYGVSIQIKATKQYSPVVLFILLYKVVLSFLSLYLQFWFDKLKIPDSALLYLTL